jgi:chromosomal replication initiator protein
VSIRFDSAAANGTAAIKPDAPKAKAPTARVAAPGPIDSRGTLNPRSTFEAFVVGENNRFAHAAAMAVAEAPARTYNPLFLHGRVGLGKTHLMQAIGHLIQRNKKHLKVFYVTSEQFTNDYISAIQQGELAKFRKSYRQVDVLLIDDIQFLAGKDRSQEEFFHTFNTLCDGSKQIVLTSDSPPTEIANLEKRLVSRFEMGLTAELQLPDAETRLAILRHKMHAMPEKLSDAVLTFIAERVKTNVRRLEGALNRVAAFATLHGRAISVPQVEVLLRDLLQQEGQQTVSIDVIQRRVAETYDLRLADMSSKRRPANIALPRMVAMYLSRRLTTASLNEIGEAFGGRDHGTVLHANRTIEEKMKTDEKLRRIVNYLAEKLVAASGS